MKNFRFVGMMRTIVRTIFLFGVVMQIFSLKVNGQYSFQRDYNYTDPYLIYITESLDSGYCIATSRQDSGNIDKILLLKTNLKGEVAWAKKISDSVFSVSAYSIVSTPDSGYLMNAAVFGCCPCVIKTDKNGNLQWIKGLGLDTISTGGYGATVTADGNNYLIAGMTSINDQNFASVFQLDQSGNLTWCTNVIETGHSLEFDGVIVTKDGGIICEGDIGDSTYYYGSKGKFLVTKLNSTGSVIWSKSYGFDESVGSVSGSIAPAPCGYYIGGRWNPGNGFPISPMLMKIDTSGNFLWCKVYSTNWFNGDNSSTVETTDGGALLMMNSYFLGSLNNGLIKVDTLGNLEWAHVYRNQYAFKSMSVLQTRDGGCLTTGYGTLGEKLRLIKTDDLGQTPCNDTLIQLDVYDKSCTVTNIGYTTTGMFTQNLQLNVIPFTLEDSLICIDTFTSIPHTPPSCEVATQTTNTIKNSFTIECNPTSNYFTLTYQTEKEVTAILIDAFGREVKRFTLYPQKKNQMVWVNDLPGGIYLLTLREDGKVETRKVIVER